MSGTVPLTIGGGYNGVSGTVTIPSSLLFGSPTAPGSINNLIQSYLGTVSNAATAGHTFINSDLAAGSTYSVAGSGLTYENFTNLDSVGTSTAGSGSYAATVGAGVTDVTVQVPGSVSLTGVSSTTTLTFGANSNVNYSVVDPDAGTVYLAGGANSVTFNALSTSNAETVYSAGSDTINLVGLGTDHVSVEGNAVVQIESADADVFAQGSATTNLYWDNAAAGGKLNFTNNSSVAAYIHIGIYNGQVNAGQVTANGGAGGGYYVGGSAGFNSLVGGSGVVTLVGGGSDNFLEASANASSLNPNVLIASGGSDTLIGSSTSGSNLFAAGLNYPGFTTPPDVSGVISTDGSGNQQFYLGNVPGGETIFGSTNADTTTQNNYLIVSTVQGSATFGGGLYSIYNFVNAQSVIYLSNGGGGAGTASITGMGVDQFDPTQYDIRLSDGTNIFLKGLTNSEISNIASHTALGITYIQG